MSYEIVYAREFIKTSDGRIIPLVLAGSNNCWETTFRGRWKRERRWTSWFEAGNASIAFPADELMQKVRANLPSTYQEHFVRNGKWVNDAGLVRFFRNGIKKAKTIEELQKEVMSTTNLIGRVTTYTNVNETCLLHSIIRNSEDLDAFLTDSEKIYRDNEGVRKVYTNLSFPVADVLKRINRKSSSNEKLEHFYFIETERGIVARLTRRHLHLNPYKEQAKQFPNKKAAEKWISDRNLLSRFRLDFEVKYSG